MGDKSFFLYINMGNEFDLHESVNISPFMTYKQKPSVEIDLVLLFATPCIGNSNLESDSMSL